MSAQNEPTPEETLKHFLELSLAQIQWRIRKHGENKFDAEMRRMRLLEELIKEQLPDENSRFATGSSR